MKELVDINILSFYFYSYKDRVIKMKLDPKEGEPGILTASFDGWDLSALQAAYREDIEVKLYDEETPQSLEEYSDFSLRINSLTKDQTLDIEVAVIGGIVSILDKFSKDSIEKAKKSTRYGVPAYRNGFPGERLALGNVAVQLSCQFGGALSGILENFGNSIDSEFIKPETTQPILLDAGPTPETAVTNDDPPLQNN